MSGTITMSGTETTAPYTFKGTELTPENINQQMAIIDWTTGNGFNNLPLFSAILFNDTQAVKTMIELGANPDAIDQFNNKAIHLACHKGNPEILEILLKNGATDGLGKSAFNFIFAPDIIEIKGKELAKQLTKLLVRYIPESTLGFSNVLSPHLYAIYKEKLIDLDELKAICKKVGIDFVDEEIPKDPIPVGPVGEIEIPKPGLPSDYDKMISFVSLNRAVAALQRKWRYYKHHEAKITTRALPIFPYRLPTDSRFAFELKNKIDQHKLHESNYKHPDFLSHLRLAFKHGWIDKFGYVDCHDIYLSLQSYRLKAGASEITLPAGTKVEKRVLIDTETSGSKHYDLMKTVLSVPGDLSMLSKALNKENANHYYSFEIPFIHALMAGLCLLRPSERPPGDENVKNFIREATMQLLERVKDTEHSKEDIEHFDMKAITKLWSQTINRPEQKTLRLELQTLFINNQSFIAGWILISLFNQRGICFPTVSTQDSKFYAIIVPEMVKRIYNTVTFHAPYEEPLVIDDCYLPTRLLAAARRSEGHLPLLDGLSIYTNLFQDLKASQTRVHGIKTAENTGITHNQMNPSPAAFFKHDAGHRFFGSRYGALYRHVSYLALSVIQNPFGFATKPHMMSKCAWGYVDANLGRPVHYQKDEIAFFWPDFSEDQKIYICVIASDLIYNEQRWNTLLDGRDFIQVLSEMFREKSKAFPRTTWPEIIQTTNTIKSLIKVGPTLANSWSPFLIQYLLSSGTFDELILLGSSDIQEHIFWDRQKGFSFKKDTFENLKDTGEFAGLKKLVFENDLTCIRAALKMTVLAPENKPKDLIKTHFVRLFSQPYKIYAHERIEEREARESAISAFYEVHQEKIKEVIECKANTLFIKVEHAHNFESPCVPQCDIKALFHYLAYWVDDTIEAKIDLTSTTALELASETDAKHANPALFFGKELKVNHECRLTKAIYQNYPINRTLFKALTENDPRKLEALLKQGANPYTLHPLSQKTLVALTAEGAETAAKSLLLKYIDGNPETCTKKARTSSTPFREAPHVPCAGAGAGAGAAAGTSTHSHSSTCLSEIMGMFPN